MKVILLQELKGRGGEGDVIEVARGFAVNYLLPRKVAIEATSGNLKQLEQRRHNIEKRETARISDAEGQTSALEGKTVTISAKVGEEGRLFGSVTTPMIEEAIREQLGVEIDRRKIETHGHIKEVGEHVVDVQIYRELKAHVTVQVVAEGAPIPETIVTEVEGVTADGVAFVEVEEELPVAAEEAVVEEEAAEVEAVEEEAAE
ncbi:MAG TPA: 50S ribosomal protein L9 [Coriobacteriia bacterium]|nr:50S ribosomal protein L9 [Coriobacteriia bacterium]